MSQIKVTGYIPNDGYDFGFSLKAPHHGVGPDGIEGQDDETWATNLAFADKVKELVYHAFGETEAPIPKGGLQIDVEIGEGVVDFDEIYRQTFKVVEDICYGELSG